MDKKQPSPSSSRETGLFSAFSAYVIWGILPLYWKGLTGVPSAELLAWRVTGCAVLAWAVLILRRRPLALLRPTDGEAAHSGMVIRVLAAAILIGLNWGVYLWAVETEKMVEASLGYYINPLVNVFLGMIFFSEKLGKIRFAALMLAFIGVMIMTVQSGVVPWVSLALALTFGLYALVTKQFPSSVDSIEALGWEMVVLGPLGVLYLLREGINGTWHIAGFGLQITVLLLFAGAITLLPLWLFGRGAKKLPLGVLGFLQYIAPTMMLLLGVAAFGEPFGWGKAAAFFFILVALGLYSSTFKKKQDGST